MTIGLPAPQIRGRVTGMVYLLFFVTAIGGAVVAPEISAVGGLPTNAAATAHYIQSHVGSVQTAVALGLVSTGSYVALVALFYQLFKRVSPTVALLMAFFGMVGNCLIAVGLIFQTAPLSVLGNASYLPAFTADQLAAAALLLLTLSARAGSTSLVFFGSFQLALGYLIFKSRFLPRAIGVVIALAGAGWLLYLAPALIPAVGRYVQILGIVAEGSLMLWLLFVGINYEKENPW
jgi:hypothetical protein